MKYVDIVFDGPPSHESGRFIESEGPDGASVNVGEWIDRGDGYWALRVPLVPADLLEACKTLSRESVGDYVYNIRENELLGWDGPRVKAWSDAAAVIDLYAKEAV